MKVALVAIDLGDGALQAQKLAAFARKNGVDPGSCEAIIFSVHENAGCYAAVNCKSVLIVRPDWEDFSQYSAEPVLKKLAALLEEREYQLMVFAGGTLEKEVAAQLALQKGRSALLDIEAFAYEGWSIRAKRGVYSHNLIGEFLLERPPFFLGMAETAIFGKEDVGTPSITEQRLDCQGDDTWFCDAEMHQERGEDDLAAAKIVVIGGRGVGSRQNMKILCDLAEALGGAVAGSRPAVMNGWLPLDRVIGMSGKSISPKCCIIFGVSGAMPFLVGVEQAEKIIAVNMDASSFIFRNCDVKYVGDWKPVANELLRLACALPVKQEDSHGDQ